MEPGLVHTSAEKRKIMEHQIAQKNVKSAYQRRRRNVYYFLERPASRLAMVYHLSNLLLIVISIAISILSTIETHERNTDFMDLVLYYELFLLSWFSVEYIVRLWSSSFLSKYKGLQGKLRFMATFYMVVDAFVILSTAITAILHIKTAYFTILRITRFLQIFRILRIDRQRGDLRMMALVVNKHKKELVTCYFVGFIILFGGTYIIYICEKSNDGGSIKDMANGLYWAMITVTSVGYGDFSPTTWAGKMLTGIFALVGCAFFALPAGILGSGFALQVAKQKKQKKYMKVRNPAAILIQCCWRNHAVRKENHNLLHATWYHFFPYVHKTKQGPFEILDAKEQAELAKTRKAKRSFRMQNGAIAIDVIDERANAAETNQVVHKPRKLGSFRKRSSHETANVARVLKNEYKVLVQFLIRIKFWQAVKTFKNTRYPFVNVQDIMEKNASSHTETLAHLKRINESLMEFKQELIAMKRDMKMHFGENYPKIKLSNSFDSNIAILVDEQNEAPEVDKDQKEHLINGGIQIGSFKDVDDESSEDEV